MIENLNELVRSQVQEAVVNNNEIPNEHNEAVIQAASSSIFDSLKDQLSPGNIGNLINIFKGQNPEGHPVAEQASGSFVDKLQALGINTDTAKGIAAQIIPAIIGKFTQKTADPNDHSFNFQEVLGKLAGGSDGKFDLSDLAGIFGGKKEEQTPGTPANGENILDKLKGLF